MCMSQVWVVHENGNALLNVLILLQHRGGIILYGSGHSLIFELLGRYICNNFFLTLSALHLPIVRTTVAVSVWGLSIYARRLLPSSSFSIKNEESLIHLDC